MQKHLPNKRFWVFLDKKCSLNGLVKNKKNNENFLSRLATDNAATSRKLERIECFTFRLVCTVLPERDGVPITLPQRNHVVR